MNREVRARRSRLCREEDLEEKWMGKSIGASFLPDNYTNTFPANLQILFVTLGSISSNIMSSSL